MKDKLLKLLNNSYAPYSNFPVASIVITKDGKEFCGVNIENVNGTSICAERHAIGNAIANGYKKGNFKEIYVMGLNTEKNITPCFACRQVLLEFFEKTDSVHCMNKFGDIKTYTINELCPYPFEDLD